MPRVLAILGVLVLTLSLPGVTAVTAAIDGARLAPERGKYVGAILDWNEDRAEAYDQRLGRRAAVYGLSVDFPLSAVGVDPLQRSIGQIAVQGGLALVTVNPTVPLAAIDAGAAEDLAIRLATYNVRYGVPILLRFAPQMNGSWYSWGQQPGDYVRAFRAIAVAVHGRTNQIAMVWSPNYGAGYPFPGGRQEVRPGSAVHTILDTNRDGVVDQRDDPYSPYYPGDDAVDWVGLNLYHWGETYPWGRNDLPGPGKFAQQLAGTYGGLGGDRDPAHDFYRAFVRDRRKPLAIETAALYNPGAAGADELALKEAWWRQVFDPEVARAFPGIALVVWLEVRRAEDEVGGATIDWRATHTAALAAAYRADLDREDVIFGPITAERAAPRSGGWGGRCGGGAPGRQPRSPRCSASAYWLWACSRRGGRGAGVGPTARRTTGAIAGSTCCAAWRSRSSSSTTSTCPPSTISLRRSESA